MRPLAGWATLAFGADWLRPARRQNGTSFYYFATDQWRYERVDAKIIASPLAGPELKRHPADYNVISLRSAWWLPSYPQFDANPVDLCEESSSARGLFR